MGALFTAHHLGCKAILALTESGSTALWMSRHNIHVPIFGLTSQVDDAAQHGAVPQRAAAPDADLRRPRHTRWRQAEALLVERGVLQAGRHLRHHLRRADGLPGRHQHAQGVPGRLSRAAHDLGTPLALRASVDRRGRCRRKSRALPEQRCPSALSDSSTSGDSHHATRLHAPTAGPCRRKRLRHSGLQRQQPRAGAGRHDRGRGGRRAGDPAGQRRRAQVRRRALHQAPDPGGDRGLAAGAAGDAPGPRPEPRRLPGRDRPRLQLGDDGRLAAGRRQDDRQLRLQRRRHAQGGRHGARAAASRSRASSAAWARWRR